MTPAQTRVVYKAIHEIDRAMDLMEAEIERVRMAVAAGVTLEVIGNINRILLATKESSDGA